VESTKKKSAATKNDRNTTKKDLIEAVAARTKMRRTDVKIVVQCLLDQIVDELGKGKRLELRDFGVFEVRERAQREAQNPKTMEKVVVPPKRAVKFKSGRKMCQALDGHAAGVGPTVEVVAGASIGVHDGSMV
jgi:integration host factor subunit beta